MGVVRRRRNVPDAKPPMGGGIGDGIKIATDVSGGGNCFLENHRALYQAIKVLLYGYLFAGATEYSGGELLLLKEGGGSSP